MVPRNVNNTVYSDHIEETHGRWRTRLSSTMKMAANSKKTRLIALCRHELPSGPPHLDLFLGPEGPAGDEDRVVLTWRLNEDPMSLLEEEFREVTPLSMHRGKYLHLDGPVEPRSTQGTVTPLRRGHCTVEEEPDRPLLVTIRWEDGSSGCFELNDQYIKRLPMTGPHS